MLPTKEITRRVPLDGHQIRGIRVAVSLVNALMPGHDRGRSFAAPSDSAHRRQAVQVALGTDESEPLPDDADVAALASLALRLHAIFAAVESGSMDGAVTSVNTLLRRSGAVPQLDHHGDGPWHLHFHGRAADLSTRWSVGCGVALAMALGSELATRLGVCRASGCDRVYFDESRNGSRRYCSLACQNRAKASAHRARARALT